MSSPISTTERGTSRGYEIEEVIAMLAKLMPMNLGSLERLIRVIVGMALLSLVFLGPRSPWGWFGLVPLATGLFGSCPLYTLLGISTCRGPIAQNQH